MLTNESLRSLIAEATELLECSCKCKGKADPESDDVADDEMDLGGTNKRGDPTANRSATAVTPCPSGQVRQNGVCSPLRGASWKTLPVRR